MGRHRVRVPDNGALTKLFGMVQTARWVQLTDCCLREVDRAGRAERVHVGPVLGNMGIDKR